MKKTYKITITDTATYYIDTEDVDDATELALEWFSERKPDVSIEETDEEAEYEIK